jgi:hypothetical protein
VRPMHLTHAAAAERRQDLIRTKPITAKKCHV